MLAEVTTIALTSDGWTAINDRKFLGITLHTFYRGELVALCLGLPECPSGDAALMADLVRRTLAEYELQNVKIMAMVTDGASNMKAMCHQLDYTRVGCMAHMIDLIMKKCFKVRSSCSHSLSHSLTDPFLCKATA